VRIARQEGFDRVGVTRPDAIPQAPARLDYYKPGNKGKGE